MEDIFEKYLRLIYATGGHQSASLRNGVGVYLHKGDIYYEGNGCFKHRSFGYLYFIDEVDGKFTLTRATRENYIEVGYMFSLNLAIYLLEKADGNVRNVVFDSTGTRSFFRIYTDKGSYVYYDSNHFENREIIEYLYESFSLDIEKYPLDLTEYKIKRDEKRKT